MSRCCPTYRERLQQKALTEAEHKFRKSCEQLTLLNRSLMDIQERYRRAKADNSRCFRYNLRMKLSVVEGVRNMFYDYAHSQAEKIVELRHELYGENVDIVNGGVTTAADGNNVNGDVETPTEAEVDVTS